MYRDTSSVDCAPMHNNESITDPTHIISLFNDTFAIVGLNLGSHMNINCNSQSFSDK